LGIILPLTSFEKSHFFTLAIVSSAISYRTTCREGLDFAFRGQLIKNLAQQCYLGTISFEKKLK